MTMSNSFLTVFINLC